MRNKLLFAMAFALLPFCATAQTEADETAFDFRSRTSISADWKVCRKLHLEGSYELRSADCVSRIERHQLTLGLDWSPLKHFDIGGGYSFIGHYDSDGNFRPRNRFYLDLGADCKFGAWKICLKQRVQLTCKAYEVNGYQQTPDFLELKSRLKATYKGLVHLEPYAYAELRNCCNAPYFSYSYDAAEDKYTDYQFLGYKDAYVNRIRAALGMQWNIDRHNGIDFRLMADWCSDKNIDTNSEGTKLKSFCWEKTFVPSVVAGYVFSF